MPRSRRTSKLFSGASTAFGAEPNSHVSLVDAAMPGMLPVINGECVAQAVRTGLGLKAQINLKSVFDRKNYFYPDLPQGYQISQYKQPVVGEGEVEIDCRRRADDGRHRAAASRAGRRQVAARPAPDDYSYVDLNRSGVALMEIVSKPDMRSSEAGAGLRHEAAHASCAISAPATATWRRAICAPTSTSRSASPASDARHALRDQERQFHPLHRPGDRGRGAPADRDHRGWRQDRPGNAPVRPGQGRDAIDALEGRSARLPLFPRSRSFAARADAGLCRAAQSQAAGASRREAGALHERHSGFRLTTPTCSSPSGRLPITSRASPRAATARSPRTGSSTNSSAG